MKYFKLLLLSLSIFYALWSCKHNSREVTAINYFNQEIPVNEAEIFAPGLISLEDRWEGNANFSFDGSEFYFNVFTDSMRRKKIYWSKYINGEWTESTVLEAIGDYNNWEPFISYSGKELFFVSTRPPGQDEWNGRIWSSAKDPKNNWTEPQYLNLGYETKNGFWFPNHSQLSSNIIYFGGNIENHKSVGMGDLYYYNIAKDSVVNIETLNSENEDWDPFISSDESYILWASERQGGFGGTDIYISFKHQGKWDQPINMGKEINSSGYEVAPRISSDGKILFFDRPSKGSQDIFWISSRIIEKLKRQNTK